MFSGLLKDSSKKKRPLDIRKQCVDATPGRATNGAGHPQRRPRPKAGQSAQARTRQVDDPTHLLPQQRQSARRARSSSSAIDFGTEHSDSGSGNEAVETKRARISVEGPTVSRRVRRAAACDESPTESTPIVHAAEIPKLDKATKYEACFEDCEDAEVEVQYPSSMPRERFALIKPSHDDSAFNAIADIISVMHTVSEHFVPGPVRSQFDDEMHGYPQRLKRAVKKRLVTEFKDVISSYNDHMRELLQNQSLGKQLDEVARCPPKLVEQILNQTYARTVSPNIKSLRVYEAGTDNVYGELLPRFVSEILAKDVRMTPDQVFVDLGSGVGNVVLQAALEIGCESWGCEVMEHSCNLADRQLTEFSARCRMWGLSVGDVHLERGDFLINDTIKGVLRRADVVLVNNQVFTPALNEALTTLFLDLKDGCRVVSLRSFVPAGYRITERNSENPLNLLSVQARTYFSNCVSWTSQGGSYFVSKKDSGRIRRIRSAAIT